VQRMKVEIWSDVVCPWCYIGKRRFESALERFEHHDQVEVEYRSFQLDPLAEKGQEGGLDERLARKYGVDLERARAMNAKVTQTAAGEGLAYRLDIARPGNTFDVHRLIHLAAAEGRQAEMKERALAAYFTEGRRIDDADTLVELAAEAGLDAGRARQALDGDEFAADVRADEREAAELGITGVPFFVLDRRYGVSGAQPAEVMTQALQQAWRDAHPITVVAGPARAAEDAADVDGAGGTAACDDGACPI
jgi:predicted DsbA family dithiol-disulfide isomerase